jgi:DNA-binding protein HU-beta
MNKAALIQEIVKHSDLTIKEASNILDVVLNSIIGSLNHHEKVTLLGFGVFEIVKRAARVGRNPKTGKEIKIPATHAVKFKAGKYLKDVVAGKIKMKAASVKATKKATNAKPVAKAAALPTKKKPTITKKSK